MDQMSLVDVSARRGQEGVQDAELKVARNAAFGAAMYEAHGGGGGGGGGSDPEADGEKWYAVEWLVATASVVQSHAWDSRTAFAAVAELRRVPAAGIRPLNSFWSISPFVGPCIGALVHWSIGPFVHLSIRPHLHRLWAVALTQHAVSSLSQPTSECIHHVLIMYKPRANLA